MRNVDSTVLLIDLETGWTWKRISTNPQRPPRWQRTSRFESAEEAQRWVTENKPVPPDPRMEQTHLWAAEVLLNPEYSDGEQRPAVIRRWTSSPTLSVFGATVDQKSLVERTVGELNAVLKNASSLKVRIQEDGDKNAAIQVHFLPLASFGEFARSRGVKYSGRDHGTFWTNWDTRNQMIDATVLIAADIADDALLRHLVLEEITQSLGPMNDSARKRDSMFFSGTSLSLTLSEEDRQLLTLLYKRLRPGSSPSQLRRAVSRYWKFQEPATPKDKNPDKQAGGNRPDADPGRRIAA